jgi:DNA-binding response OmpR family regulator
VTILRRRAALDAPADGEMPECGLPENVTSILPSCHLIVTLQSYDATVFMEWRKPKVLVVDDEPDAVELVAFNLTKAGMEVVRAEDGIEALTKAREILPDAMVLDLMLPGMDGLEVCRSLRREPKTATIPIIMVTAKGAEVDRVLGLELGADDYITKPFSPRELVLRVKKLLQPRQPLPDSEQLRIGEILINLPTHEVVVSGQAVELTLTEFKLISVMAQRCGRVQSREQLLNDVWEYHSPIDTRTVDTHVRRLREKLGPAARHLDTVRGVGYRLVERPKADSKVEQPVRTRARRVSP